MSLRVGVVGCGKIAERHLNAYAKIDAVDVVVSDIDESKRSIVADRDIGWAEDPDELIRAESIDAVDVCTPVNTHEEIISTAIETGKHVFCEKPLAPSLEAARRLVALSETTDSILMIGYLYRFHPAFQMAKELLNEGIIGNPYTAIFRVGGRGSTSAWKHKAAMGGGAANEMLVHMLDLVNWYFGGITTAKNLITETLLPQREVNGEIVEADAEDYVLLDLQTEAGARVLCQSDLVTPSYMNYVEIHGTNGSIMTSIIDEFPAFVYCKEPRGIYDRGHTYKNFSHVDLFVQELRYFVDCIRDQRSLDWSSVQAALAVREVIDETLGGPAR